MKKPVDKAAADPAAADKAAADKAAAAKVKANKADNVQGNEDIARGRAASLPEDHPDQKRLNPSAVKPGVDPYPDTGGNAPFGTSAPTK